VKNREPGLYTLDTSVLTKLFLDDQALAAEAREVFEGFSEGRFLLVVPIIAQYETAATILREARERQISDAWARASLESLFDLGVPVVGDVNETRDIVLRAYPVARELGRSIYQAAFLVLSASLNAPLITADREFFEAVQDVFRVIWLGDLQLP
jgi:predicted nucleic acid-binding protein